MFRQTAISSFRDASAFYRVHWQPLLAGGALVVSGLMLATLLLGPVATFLLTALTAGFYATTYSVIDTGHPSWRLFPKTVTKRVGKLVRLYLVISVLTLLLTAIGAGIFFAVSQNAFQTVQATTVFGLVTTPIAGFIVSTAMRFMLVATVREEASFAKALRINSQIWRAYPLSILTYTAIRAVLLTIPITIAAVGILSILPPAASLVIGLLVSPVVLSFMYTYHLLFYEAIAMKMGAPWRS